MIQEKLRRNALFLILPLLAALLSFFVLAGVASSSEFHKHSIAALEEKQTTVLELSAASAAASAAITLIPGDAATPIAEQLADLSSHFLVVLCAIYLEKYLLTITGFLAFKILIPVACLAYILNVLFDWRGLRLLAGKLAAFGLLIVLVIPVSLQLSNTPRTPPRRSRTALRRAGMRRASGQVCWTGSPMPPPEPRTRWAGWPTIFWRLWPSCW